MTLPSGRALFTLKLLLVLSILAWLLLSGRLDLARFRSLAASPALASLVVLRVVAALIPVFRWHFIANGLGLPFTLRQSAHIGLIGNFFNSVTPSTLGQDATRLLLGRKRQHGSEAALVSSIATDRLVGLAALALVGLCFGGAYQLTSTLPNARWLALAPLAFLCGLVLFAMLTLGGLSLLRGRFLAPARRILHAVDHARSHPRLLFFALLLSIAGHLTVLASYYVAFHCLGGNPPWLAVFAISPVIALLRGVPLTPMGLGIMEWSSELLYSLAGLRDGAEVVLLVRAVTLLFGLLCGALIFAPIESQEAHETR